MWKLQVCFCLWLPLSMLLGRANGALSSPGPAHLSSLLTPNFSSFALLTTRSPPGPHAVSYLSAGKSLPFLHCLVSFSPSRPKCKPSSSWRPLLFSSQGQLPPSSVLCSLLRLHCGVHWTPSSALWMCLPLPLLSGLLQVGPRSCLSLFPRYARPPTYGVVSTFVERIRE